MEKKIQLHLKLPDKTLKRLHDQAKVENRSAANFIKNLIIRAMEAFYP